MKDIEYYKKYRPSSIIEHLNGINLPTEKVSILKNGEHGAGKIDWYEVMRLTNGVDINE